MEGIVPFLPPLVVFILGVWTHRIIFSLFTGIVTAALIASSGSAAGTLSLIGRQFFLNCEIDKWTSWESFTCTNKLFIMGFIFASGALFTLVKKADGIQALVKMAEKRIKSARSAETTSLILSHTLFIDGCLSSITVSSIMRPISDRFRIPRVKTALLADSMSGPLVVICPFSAFAALIIGLLSSNGVRAGQVGHTLLNENPNSVYFSTLPYLFYSLTAIATLWLIVRARITLGAMKRYEKPGDEQIKAGTGHSTTARSCDFFIPVLMFPAFIIFYVVLMDKGSVSLWNMLTESPIAFVLCAASVSALFFGVIYYRLSGRFFLKESTKIILASMRGGFKSVLVIFLAWTLADILKDNLKLGNEISSLLSGSISITFLPLICFWISSIVSASLGTAWGTVAIFIPLAAPTVLAMQQIEPPATLEQIPILLPTLGAIISGGAFGDHVSLLSDSTILSSAGAECHPVDHFKTQWFYAVPIYAASSAGFLGAGLLAEAAYPFSFLGPLVISIFLSLGIVTLLHLCGTTSGDRIPS